MKKKTEPNIQICPDCGEKNEINKNGICKKCARRKANMKYMGKKYIPYIKLAKEEKEKINARRMSQANRTINTINNIKKLEHKEHGVYIEEPELTVPDNNNYYSAKANQTEVITHPIPKPISKNSYTNSLSHQDDFINILRECGCEIPDESLKDVLNILINTDKLKNIFMTIAKGNNQQALLDLEQALNVVERKLQHNWEYNGFQEEDDIKFKNFLTWRRTLKGAIFFWKKLYQTNTIIEMQRAWNAYTQDPNEKILLVGDHVESNLKRFQITTESISTIFNTKKPFTRVFYAQDQDKAYEMFVKWMSDRHLHENKSKTVITELKNDGSKDGRKDI